MFLVIARKKNEIFFSIFFLFFCIHSFTPSLALMIYWLTRCFHPCRSSRAGSACSACDSGGDLSFRSAETCSVEVAGSDLTADTHINFKQSKSAEEVLRRLRSLAVEVNRTSGAHVRDKRNRLIINDDSLRRKNTTGGVGGTPVLPKPAVLAV